ncbi:hypothetical protein ACTMU2_40085 [Cupriavidus basilensis]
MLGALAAVGGVLLTSTEKARLQALMWQDGKLAGQATGQSARRIAELAGLERVRDQQPTMLASRGKRRGQRLPVLRGKARPC